MRLAKWQIISLGTVAFILLLLVVLAKLPLRLVFAEKMEAFGVTDINGASFSGGRLWVSNEHLPGLAEVTYRWCPLQGLKSWCVDVEHPLVGLEAVLSVGSDKLRVTRGDLRMFSSSLLGAKASLVDLSLKGEVEELVISSFDCPMQHIDRLVLQLTTEQVTVQLLNTSLGAHQIKADTTGGDTELNLTGDSLTGLVRLSGDAYEASGELLSNERIAGLAKAQMRSLGDNRFGWELKGKLPCS